MNLPAIITTLICCLTIGGTLQAQRSTLDSAKGTGCKPSIDTAYEHVSINGINHQYYLHSKIYMFTDTSRQHQYEGIFILKTYRQTTKRDRKALARKVADKYGLRQVMLVSDCSILNMMYSSLAIDPKAVKRRRRLVEENSILYSANELKTPE